MEFKKKTQKTVKTIINKMIDTEFLGWPPECFGIVHQPVRPRMEDIKEESSEIE